MSDERYTFSSDWFTAQLPVWERHLRPLRARPGLRYLEVGVYEGRSLFWMLDNVLTGVSACATAVDAFFPEQAYGDVFRANLARSGHAGRVEVLAGDSAAILRTLRGPFDVIYIDGGHGPHSWYFDLAFAWELLAPDGLILLDDYQKGAGRLAREVLGATVIDAFVAAVSLECEVVHRGYQLFLRRVGPRHVAAAAAVSAEHRGIASAVGDWFYFWEPAIIVRADGGDPIHLPAGPLRDMFERALRLGGGRRWLGWLVELARRRA